MSRQIGIDIRPHVIRVASLRSSYRRVVLEGLREVQRTQYENLTDALTAAVEPYLQHHEGIAIGLSGTRVFIHRIPLPPAALKQVAEVLPFELEAQVPVDFEELVYDFRVLPREKGEDKVEVLAAAATIQEVTSIIQLTRDALGQDPERVGAGPLPLGNLAQLSPDIQAAACVALLDVGEETSDLLILAHGTCAFARTLSVGVAGLPDNAEEFLSKLRVSLTAWLSVSEHAVDRLFVMGAGPASPGMLDYLAAHLNLQVDPLPELKIDTQVLDGSTTPTEEQVAQNQLLLASHAKALALALGLRPGARDLNLRQGAMQYQQGYSFLKERLPVLVGLVSVAIVSFVFSAWAEGRALSAENDILADSLATLSAEILHHETADVDEVFELLDSGGEREQDPQPQLDGFDLMLTLAQRIPKEIEHDVQELDLQKGRVTLRAVVPKTDDAQRIAEELKKQECLRDVKISQIAAVVGSDRQKYSMEFEMRCQDTTKKKKKPVVTAEEEE